MESFPENVTQREHRDGAGKVRRPAWLDQPVAEEYKGMVEVEPVPAEDDGQ